VPETKRKVANFHGGFLGRDCKEGRRSIKTPLT